MGGVRGVYFSLYLLILLASGGNANPVCDFTVNPHEPKWVSAATILAETIVGYIPVVGKWAEAFIEIMALTQEESYSIDVFSCVETLIEQKLEDDVKKSTDTFITYWNTTIAVWNISDLVSNTSHTKAEMADQIWSEAFAGALDVLPNVEKKEQVFTLWLDMATTETFIFESTAVQYTEAFGNGSKESCQQWKVAKDYTGVIIKDLEDKMINCPETCLTTSTYARSSNEMIAMCHTCSKSGIHHMCSYWISDKYNCTCSDYDECNISGNCGGPEKCSNWDEQCHWDDDGQENCKKDTDDYRKRLDDYVERMQKHVDKAMKWLNDRQHIIKEQVERWCVNPTTTTTTTTITTATTSTTTTTTTTSTTSLITTTSTNEPTTTVKLTTAMGTTSPSKGSTAGLHILLILLSIVSGIMGA